MNLRLITSSLLLLVSPVLWSQSWEFAKNEGVATLDIHWCESEPFIFLNDTKLAGIEYELLEAFKVYAKEKRGVELTFNWIKVESFSGILEKLKSAGDENFLGASAFSITDKRKELVDFSHSYLPDITVLVSSKGSPIASTLEEINLMVSKMEAVTIKETTYEKLLKDLQIRLNNDFKIHYLDDSRSIFENLSKEPNRFGFIDLPVYLMWFENGGDLTRQNFFTVKGQGYAFMLPRNSDWIEPINMFLNDPASSEIINAVISKYLGKDLLDFIYRIQGEDAITTTILTEEKKFQLEQIRNANLELEHQYSLRYVLVIGIVITGLFLIALTFSLFRNQKTTKLLIKQRDQIFKQQEDIRLKNEQLMNRNTQLMSINEEKNNLVKILAHDIRSPLSQIIMITDILLNPSEEVDQQKEEFLKQIGVGASRINEMVAKILHLNDEGDSRVNVMKERVDVRDILKEIKGRFEHVAENKNIILKVMVSGDYYIIQSDHLLLTLILENLVSNAIKFSSSNTCVSLMVDCKQDEAIFKVSDEGPGFSEEDKKLMFNRFQTLSAEPTGGETSIGLGLSIVKKYVTDIGGKLWLESEKGKGTTFFIKLSS